MWNETRSKNATKLIQLANTRSMRDTINLQEFNKSWGILEITRNTFNPGSTMKHEKYIGSDTPTRYHPRGTTYDVFVTTFSLIVSGDSLHCSDNRPKVFLTANAWLVRSEEIFLCSGSLYFVFHVFNFVAFVGDIFTLYTGSSPLYSLCYVLCLLFFGPLSSLSPVLCAFLHSGVFITFFLPYLFFLLMLYISTTFLYMSNTLK